MTRFALRTSLPARAHCLLYLAAMPAAAATYHMPCAAYTAPGNMLHRTRLLSERTPAALRRQHAVHMPAITCCACNTPLRVGVNVALHAMPFTLRHSTCRMPAPVRTRDMPATPTTIHIALHAFARNRRASIYIRACLYCCVALLTLPAAARTTRCRIPPATCLPAAGRKHHHLPTCRAPPRLLLLYTCNTQRRRRVPPRIKHGRTDGRTDGRDGWMDILWFL